MTDPDADDSPLKFRDGKDFKFSDEISINTTRTHANTPNTHASTTHESTPNASVYNTPPRGSPSILKSSSSVTSSVTHGSRLVDLEQGMQDMNHDVKDMKENLKLMLAFVKESTKVNNPTDKDNVPPSPPPGGDGA